MGRLEVRTVGVWVAAEVRREAKDSILAVALATKGQESNREVASSRQVQQATRAGG